MNQNGAGLQLGDRLPNFMRNDQDNKPFVLYGDVCARQLLLLLITDPQLPALTAEMAALDDTQILPENIVRLGMICGDPGQAADFARQRQANFTILADDGEIMRFLLGQTTTQGLHAFLLDANTHVIGRLSVVQNPTETLAGQAARIFQQFRFPKPRIVAAQAPVLFIPQVFESDFCKTLIEAFHQRGNEPSGVLKKEAGKMVYEQQADTKIRLEHRVIDDDLRSAIEIRLAQRRQRRIRRGEIHWCSRNCPR